MDEAGLGGYDQQELIGYSIKKKKMRLAKRYEVRTFERGNYNVFDLSKNQKMFEKHLPVRRMAQETCDDLNNFKQDKVEVEMVQDYLAGQLVTLFNDYYEVENFEDYKINHAFYIE